MCIRWNHHVFLPVTYGNAQLNKIAYLPEPQLGKNLLTPNPLFHLGPIEASLLAASSELGSPPRSGH
jgi:hypothetical protein